MAPLHIMVITSAVLPFFRPFFFLPFFLFSFLLPSFLQAIVFIVCSVLPKYSFCVLFKRLKGLLSPLLRFCFCYCFCFCFCYCRLSAVSGTLRTTHIDVKSLPDLSNPAPAPDCRDEQKAMDRCTVV